MHPYFFHWNSLSRFDKHWFDWTPGYRVLLANEDCFSSFGQASVSGSACWTGLSPASEPAIAGLGPCNPPAADVEVRHLSHGFGLHMVYMGDYSIGLYMHCPLSLRLSGIARSHAHCRDETLSWSLRKKVVDQLFEPAHKESSAHWSQGHCSYLSPGLSQRSHYCAKLLDLPPISFVWLTPAFANVLSLAHLEIIVMLFGQDSLSSVPKVTPAAMISGHSRRCPLSASSLVTAINSLCQQHQIGQPQHVWWSSSMPELL